jgi:hypothetical protein
MSCNTSPTEIIEIHVPYEINMLLATFVFLRVLETSEFPQRDQHQRVIYNALIESFCVHARTLIDFFKSKHGMKTKEFAARYTPKFVDKIDEELTKKLNQQIAHLTYKRTDDPNEKIGPKEREMLLQALIAEIDLFSGKLKKGRQPQWPYVTTRTSIGPKFVKTADATGSGASSSIETVSLKLGS